MSFHVIAGTYHVVGYSPDGDSIRFKANTKAHWEKLSGPPVKMNAAEHAQLRLEAIDTLETHFRNVSQPSEFAIKALDFLLQSVGITGAKWDVLRTRVISANDGTPGFIVARTVEKNRRPVAFAFAGAPPVPDGSSLFFDTTLLKNSVNYKALVEGLAYPTFYTGLFPDLRDELVRGTAIARAATSEIWKADVTNAGFGVTSLQSITDKHVILPKLFRRLVEYLEAGGGIAGFDDFLEAQAERITILSTGHFTHFDTIVKLSGTTVTMTEPPENVVFEG
jgi:hypothetical protein